jgi:hypothetical protein
MDINALRQHRADLENSLRNSISEQIDAFRDKTGFSPQRISVDMAKIDVIGDTEPRYCVVQVDVDIQV